MKFNIVIFCLNVYGDIAVFLKCAYQFQGFWFEYAIYIV